MFKAASKTLLDLWCTKCEKGEASVIVDPYLRALTFDVILQCVMGVKSGIQTASGNKALTESFTGIDKAVEITGTRIHNPLLYPDIIFYSLPIGRRYLSLLQKSSNFSLELVRKRRQELKEVGDAEVKNTMLDTLLTMKDQSGIGMSDEEIKDQFTIIIAAALDTAVSSLCWALFELARHEDVQDKCRQEVDVLVSEIGSLEALDSDHMVKLKYLTWTLHETMRMYPQAVSVVRETDREITIDGVRIPAGAPVDLGIYDVHHNPTVWPEPETFDPERFSPERRPKNLQFAFFPFGSGSFACPGSFFAKDELRVVLANIVSRFLIRPDPEAPDVSYQQFLTAKACPYVQVRLVKISE